MGYVALALLTGSRAGKEAVAFYVVAYTAMNLAAFGAIAVLSDENDMDRADACRGLGRSRPFAAGVLALSMFALAGIPPTAGFIGKFFIFAAAIRSGEVPLAIIGILTAAVSAYYYLQVVINLYTPHQEQIASATGTPPCQIAALFISAVVILFLGFYPAPLLSVISAVFG